MWVKIVKIKPEQLTWSLVINCESQTDKHAGQKQNKSMSFWRFKYKQDLTTTIDEAACGSYFLKNGENLQG